MHDANGAISSWPTSSFKALLDFICRPRRVISHVDGVAAHLDGVISHLDGVVSRRNGVVSRVPRVAGECEVGFIVQQRRPPQGALSHGTHERPGKMPGRSGFTSFYKPSFVSPPGRPASGGDHSSRTTVARRLKQPTRRLERAALVAPAYVALLPMGFALPLALPRARWALTPPFHPCRRSREQATAVSFLWHSPRRFRHRALPGIVLCGARTFLPRAPSIRDAPAITQTA